MKISQIHSQLAEFINNDDIKSAIDAAQARVLQELRNNRENFSVSIEPDQIKKIVFPKYSQLIRVYGAKNGVKGKVERHPNSFQTLYTSYGEGKTLTIEPNDGFEEVYYDDQYWSFVPENVWHQPVAIKDWVCVTFHSAPAEKLIDECKNT
jgi:hypothetical protein